MLEEWRPIIGYEGIYEASSLGRLRSLDRRGKDFRKLKGKILKQSLSGRKGQDYYFVMLVDHDGVAKNKKTHRLVYEAFNGHIFSGKVIDHIDGDRFNNRADNLQCITQRENVQKAFTGHDADGDLPCGVYQGKSGAYYSMKYIDGVQYYLGSHWNIDVVECYYRLATKTLLKDKNRWKDIAYEIACVYEDFI